MFKLSMSLMVCAMLMFAMGGKSNEIAFATWGIMFMMSATIITIVGTSRHGS